MYRAVSGLALLFTLLICRPAVCCTLEKGFQRVELGETEERIVFAPFNSVTDLSMPSPLVYPALEGCRGFGRYVAVSPDYVVAWVWCDYGSQGAVLVYRYDSEGDTYECIGTLSPPTGTAYTDVYAISSEYLVVGYTALRGSQGLDVYALSGGEWTLSSTLQPCEYRNYDPDTCYPYLPSSIWLDQDTLYTSYEGVLRVYTLTQSGHSLSLTIPLGCGEGDSIRSLGYDMVGGSIVAVCSPDLRVYETRLLVRIGSAGSDPALLSWVQAPGWDTSYGSECGGNVIGVDVDGGTVAIGCDLYFDGDSTGVVKVYGEREGGGGGQSRDGEWVLDQTLTGTGERHDNYAFDISLSGGVLAVGSYGVEAEESSEGQAYLYMDQGGQWQSVATLSGAEAYMELGYNLGLLEWSAEGERVSGPGEVAGRLFWVTTNLDLDPTSSSDNLRLSVFRSNPSVWQASYQYEVESGNAWVGLDVYAEGGVGLPSAVVLTASRGGAYPVPYDPQSSSWHTDTEWLVPGEVVCVRATVEERHSAAEVVADYITEHTACVSLPHSYPHPAQGVVSVVVLGERYSVGDTLTITLGTDATTHTATVADSGPDGALVAVLDTPASVPAGWQAGADASSPLPVPVSVSDADGYETESGVVWVSPASAPTPPVPVSGALLTQDFSGVMTRGSCADLEVALYDKSGTPVTCGVEGISFNPLKAEPYFLYPLADTGSCTLRVCVPQDAPVSMAFDILYDGTVLVPLPVTVGTMAVLVICVCAGAALLLAVSVLLCRGTPPKGKDLSPTHNAQPSIGASEGVPAPYRRNYGTTRQQVVTLTVVVVMSLFKVVILAGDFFVILSLVGLFMPVRLSPTLYDIPVVSTALAVADALNALTTGVTTVVGESGVSDTGLCLGYALCCVVVVGVSLLNWGFGVAQDRLTPLIRAVLWPVFYAFNECIEVLVTVMTTVAVAHISSGDVTNAFMGCFALCTGVAVVLTAHMGKEIRTLVQGMALTAGGSWKRGIAIMSALNTKWNAVTAIMGEFRYFPRHRNHVTLFFTTNVLLFGMLTYWTVMCYYVADAAYMMWLMGTLPLEYVLFMVWGLTQPQAVKQKHPRLAKTIPFLIVVYYNIALFLYLLCWVVVPVVLVTCFVAHLLLSPIISTVLWTMPSVVGVYPPLDTLSDRRRIGASTILSCLLVLSISISGYSLSPIPVAVITGLVTINCLLTWVLRDDALFSPFHSLPSIVRKASLSDARAEREVDLSLTVKSSAFGLIPIFGPLFVITADLLNSPPLLVPGQTPSRVNYCTNLASLVAMFAIVLLGDYTPIAYLAVAVFAVLQVFDAYQEGREVAELKRFTWGELVGRPSPADRERLYVAQMERDAALGDAIVQVPMPAAIKGNPTVTARDVV
ncbi:hypothetical protein KIPB_006927 [Kipferlia bialata]|uniref:Uncharacterized protein n=1 Tax=Kipferlia bialata TaxID=797122 RepID=A0A9K3GJI0_9EUKA|nr:hypothetical protein KIPB_006927 [Kipferlia bialata]|eukprot:g6927.t1